MTRPHPLTFLAVAAIWLCCALVIVPVASAAFKGESRMANNPGIRADFAAAQEWWGASVRSVCKTLRVETESREWMELTTGREGMFGWATRDYNGDGREGDCRAAFRWKMSRCRRRYVVVHEIGHLILGPAFADSNPADPWHSPDRNHVMHSSLPYVCPWIGGV